MLHSLHEQHSEFFSQHIRDIQHFLIACCWKHKHLIPRSGLVDGFRGAEQWLDGEIDYEELNRLNWHAEAEAFDLDYSKAPEDLDRISDMIAGISELDGVPFDEARELLTRMAYFAEVTIVFEGMRPKPRAWLSIISKNAQFLCADLLRSYLEPPFD